MAEFIIDPEFRDKIPAMPQEDFDGLRNDIINDGYVRDPLVVWKEENILLDGHHRWKVIKQNWELLKGKFNVDYKSFPDRWSAIAWICANQLHKHNMTELQRMKLLQEEYEARKHTVGAADGFRGNQHTKVVSAENKHLPNSKAPKLRIEMAKEHNLGASIIERAVNVGRGIDKAAEVDPEFKREVLSGEVKAKKSALSAIRKLQTEDEVKEAIDNIRNPQKLKAKPRPYVKTSKSLLARIKTLDAEMVNASGNITFDDVLRDLNAIESDYLDKIERVFDHQKDILESDDRYPSAIDAYFDTVIKDIKELKGRFST